MSKKTREELFFSKVLKTESCWIWTGFRFPFGYGNFYIGKNKNISTHRYSYELHKGEIPEGMVVMHTCDNPPCVNPEHLVLGTQGDNLRDMMAKGRKDYSIQSGDNHWTRRKMYATS
ncbi:HNH endonuclease [bacterium]|nr:HNH endonuclease [bacterium]NDD85872.1 HNH endonuclease [bacterium]